MIAELEPRKQGGGSCPKEPWVMLALSDDEAMPSGDAMPLGLRFHLTRCPSCQAIADRLTATTTALEALTDLDPFDDLIERAQARTRSALRSGAAPKIRVETEDDMEASSDDRDNQFVVAGIKRTRTIMALAACIGLAVCALGFWRLGDRPGAPDRLVQRAAPSRTLPLAPTQRVTDVVPIDPEPVVVTDRESPPSADGSGPINAYPFFGAPRNFYTETTHRPLMNRGASNEDHRANGNTLNSERILDNSAHAVSTMPLTKDRQ